MTRALSRQCRIELGVEVGPLPAPMRPVPKWPAKNALGSGVRFYDPKDLKLSFPDFRQAVAVGTALHDAASGGFVTVALESPKFHVGVDWAVDLETDILKDLQTFEKTLIHSMQPASDDYSMAIAYAAKDQHLQHVLRQRIHGKRSSMLVVDDPLADFVSDATRWSGDPLPSLLPPPIVDPTVTSEERERRAKVALEELP